MADIDQITRTVSLGSRKGCILFLGRSDWNTGCHGNIYVVIEIKKSSFLKLQDPQL